MTSVFDYEKMLRLLQDFYRISRIRITVFDTKLNELVSYPTAVAPYCRVIRATQQGRSACMACDREACRRAASQRGTYTYQCHAGLTEAVTPLYIGDILAGYLLFGHVFSYDSYDEGWEKISRCCAELPVNRQELQAAVYQAPKISAEYVHAAAHILQAVSSNLIMERMATLEESMLVVRLDNYIKAHFTEKITAAEIAAALGVGKTQLYELAHKLYGTGIAQHIRALRMAKAKELLRSRPDMTLAQVSDSCGYSDYNYFFSVFNREVGSTPGKWRNAKG